MFVYRVNIQRKNTEIRYGNVSRVSLETADMEDPVPVN